MIQSTQICQNCQIDFEGLKVSSKLPKCWRLACLLGYLSWTLSTKKQTPANKFYHMSLLKIGQQLLFFWGSETWINVPEGVSSKKPHEVKKKKHGPTNMNKNTKDNPRRLTVNRLRSSDQQTSPIQLPCSNPLK